MANIAEQCEASRGNILPILAVVAMLWPLLLLLLVLLMRHVVGYARSCTSAPTSRPRTARSTLAAVMMPAMGAVLKAIAGCHDVTLLHIPKECVQHGAHLIVPKVNRHQKNTVMYFHHGIYDSTRNLMISFTHERKGVAPEDLLAIPRDETDVNWPLKPVMRLRKLSLMVTIAAMRMFSDTRRNKIVYEKLENFIVDEKYVIPYQDHMLHSKASESSSNHDRRFRRTPEEAVELARAFAELGDGRSFGPYEFSEWNCECFVNCVYTLRTDAEALRRRHRALQAGKDGRTAFDRQWLRENSHAVSRHPEHVMTCGLGVFFMKLSYKLAGQDTCDSDGE